MALPETEVLLENVVNVLEMEGETENSPPPFSIVTGVLYQPDKEKPEESRLILEGLGKMFTTAEVDVDKETKTVRFKAFGDDYIVRPITEEDKENMFLELREEVEELERQVSESGE